MTRTVAATHTLHIIIAILFALILVAAMTLWTALTTLPEFAAGMSHPSLSGVIIGDDSADRSIPIFLSAYLWQFAALVVANLMILLGIAPEKRERTLLGWLSGAAVVSIGVWTLLMFSYRSFLETGETSYFLGFPVASSWMIYGVWLGFLPLVILYTAGFRKFIFTLEDEAAFQAIVARENKIGAPDAKWKTTEN